MINVGKYSSPMDSMGFPYFSNFLWEYFPEISNRTSGNGPRKHLSIARLQLTERGPLGFGPPQFLMDGKNASGN